MSDSALAAAIRPKSYGSYTIGGKKSTVLTSARSGAIRYTPASSPVFSPTRRFGSTAGGRRRRTSPSVFASILAAQPAQLAHCVSRIFGVIIFMPEKSFEPPRRQGCQDLHEKNRRRYPSHG